MDKQAKHKMIIDFLDSYIKKTSKDVIEKEVTAISKIKISGASARDYFENFHKYYTRIII